MTRFTLKLFVDSQDQDLLQKYHAAVIKHNESIDNNFPSGNSGFDLYCPDDVRTLVNETIKEDSMVLVKNKTIMADMAVSGAMFKSELVKVPGDFAKEEVIPSGYCLYPRSSLSKLPLRLANSVGIIDNTYRGHLIAALDVIGSAERKQEIDEYHRLVQICAPGLDLFRVELVTNLEDLGLTDRGAGGFGSTGTN
tara:strand:+ start:2505 stop:3089 length:585 start_codon:yes stop_codon:yes gene_type:complete